MSLAFVDCPMLVAALRRVSRTIRNAASILGAHRDARLSHLAIFLLTIPIWFAGAALLGLIVFGCTVGDPLPPPTSPNFQVTTPQQTTPGTPISVIVTAKNGDGTTNTSYTGTVHFTSGDAKAILPVDTPFAAADNGVKTFNVTLNTAPSQAVTATDTADNSITGTSNNVQVSSTTDYFVLGLSAGPVTAGASVSVTLSAVLPSGNLDTNYAGTAQLTDLNASLLGTQTFSSTDQGRRTFAVTLQDAGAQTITATDTTSTAITGSSNIMVNPNSLSTFAVTAPGSVTAGTAFSITVTAEDQFGNTITNYSGTLQFQSTDIQASLPANSGLSGGTQTFTNVVLNTAGAQTITVTDMQNSISGTSSSINVMPVFQGALFGPATSVYQYPGYGNPVAVAVADLNHDGKPDLVVGDVSGVLVFPGNGDGTFATPQRYVTVYPATSVAIGDLNGDGNPDIVATSNEPDNFGVTVFLNNGSGGFQPGNSYDIGSQGAQSVAIADLNKDGIPDLVIANSGGNVNTEGVVSVLIGNGDGTFKTGTTYDSGGVDATSVAVGDLNGDGTPDLVVANSCFGLNNCPQQQGGVSVLLGNGDGTFQTAQSYMTGGPTTSVALGDANGDKHLDVFVACQTYGSGYLIGNGDGTLQLFLPLPTFAGQSVSLAVGDLNGNGTLDVAIANGFCGTTCGTGGVDVILGNGDGYFQDPLIFSTGGSSTAGIAIADLNGDKKPDLVLTDIGGALPSQVFVMLNTGP